jgi:hypothetical protein
LAARFDLFEGKKQHQSDAHPDGCFGERIVQVFAPAEKGNSMADSTPHREALPERLFRWFSGSCPR